MLALAALLCLHAQPAPVPAQPAPPGPTTELDSLRHRAATQPADTGLAQTLNELGFTLAQMGKFGEARTVLRRAQRMSERLRFATGQVRALSSLGVSYQNEGNFPQARIELDSAVALGRRLGEQSKLGTALLNRARLCNAQDDYACALQSCQAARQFFAARHDYPHLAQTLNGLGSIYSNRGDYPRAVAVLFEAVQLARQNHDAQTEVNSLGNLGNVYLKQEEYEPALQAYQQTLPRLAALPDRRAVPIAYQNMAVALGHLHRPGAETYFRQALAGFEALHQSADVGQALSGYGDFLLEAGRRPEAIGTYRRALALLHPADDANSTAGALNGLADAYLQSNQPALAATYARQALALARPIHDLPDTQLAAALLARLAKASGQYQQALRYTEQAQAANDSLFSQAKAEEIGRLQGDFQLRQEQDHSRSLAHRNELQTLRLSQQRQQLWGLGLGLLVLALAGLGLARLVVLLRRRNRLVELQRSELAELNATKNRLFSIIGHDLRSPLHSLHVFVELLAGPPLPPAQLQEYTGHLTHTLDQTLLLLENLLGWAALQMQAATPPRPVPQSLAVAVADAFDLLGPAAKVAGLHLRTTLTGAEWVLADPGAVRLVLRNLLGNALKFTSAGGLIAVAAEQQGSDWHLAVADTGQGLPVALARQPLHPGLLPRMAAPSRAPGAGLGLALCQDYARRNGGELEVASPGPGRGATFYLVLPVGEAVGC